MHYQRPSGSWLCLKFVLTSPSMRCRAARLKAAPRAAAVAASRSRRSKPQPSQQVAAALMCHKHHAVPHRTSTFQHALSGGLKPRRVLRHSSKPQLSSSLARAKQLNKHVPMQPPEHYAAAMAKQRLMPRISAERQMQPAPSSANFALVIPVCHSTASCRLLRTKKRRAASPHNAFFSNKPREPCKQQPPEGGHFSNVCCA